MIADDEELRPKPESELIIEYHFYTKFLIDPIRGIERHAHWINGKLVYEGDLPTGKTLISPMPIEY